MRRCVACVSSDDRHLSFELDLEFDWLVLLFESALDSNGIFGLSVMRVKISTWRRIPFIPWKMGLTQVYINIQTLMNDRSLIKIISVTKSSS